MLSSEPKGNYTILFIYGENPSPANNARVLHHQPAAGIHGTHKITYIYCTSYISHLLKPSSNRIQGSLKLFCSFTYIILSCKATCVRILRAIEVVHATSFYLIETLPRLPGSHGALLCSEWLAREFPHFGSVLVFCSSQLKRCV